MDVKRAGAVLAATGALALALSGVAGAAPGDTVLAGTTAEGVPVKLTVAQFGNATAFKIGKTKVECGAGTLTNRATTYTPLDTSDPGEFTDKTKGTSDNGGFHFVSKSTIHGTAAAPDDFTTWSGTFKNVTKVFQRGERIDICKVNTTWDVA
jgi:hypothetical protein